MLCDSLNADLKPKQGLELWLPLSLHDSGSDLKQNDDPDKNLSKVGCSMMLSFVGPTVAHLGVPLALTTFEL